MNTTGPHPLTAAHTVDAQLQARLDQLRALAIDHDPTGDDDTAIWQRRVLRGLLACVTCLDAVRMQHPLDADGWCIPCTTPPGAPDLSTVYGCLTRVTLARRLLGLYNPQTRLIRAPHQSGNEHHP